MSMRAHLATCLVVAAALGAAGSAYAQDQALARTTGVSNAMDGCVRYIDGQATVIRCAPAAPRLLSDHGMTAAEPYDAQGNPVDRDGNVVAVPGGRTQHREVFASEPRTPR
jgi:hypothetical protein